MRVIVACEFSGVVRDAFLAKGHEAVSCDIEPTEVDGPHIQTDIREVDLSQYDLMIAHPPCTYLCNSGIRWIKERNLYTQQKEALDFVRYLFNAPVKHICIENPIGVLSTKLCKPTQIIQPYNFGHEVKKATCLWLKDLPPLQNTKVMTKRLPSIHYMAPSKTRSKDRSRTFIGIAQAMAAQWG